MLRPRHLRPCALAILAFFLATNALPRASMYAHHHAGGLHAHVHPWGEDAGADDHDDADLDDHDHGDADHHHHATADDGPAFDESGGEHTAHVHWQSPFQRAARGDVPRVTRATIVHRFVAPLRLAIGIAPSPPASARGPPPRSAA